MNRSRRGKILVGGMAVVLLALVAVVRVDQVAAEMTRAMGPRAGEAARTASDRARRRPGWACA